MPSEVSHTQKDSYLMVSVICGISKKMIHVNLFITQKQTHEHKKHSYGYQKGKDRRRDKFGVCD